MDPNLLYIPAITTSSDCDSDSVLHDPVQAMLEAESTYIKKRRENLNLDTDNKDLVGLALSGGGIRSATFALGVLRALARRDVLEKVDYLSTVSGGGYIGASFTWLLQEKNRKLFNRDAGVSAENFPYGSDAPAGDSAKLDADEQRAMLGFLQRNGQYLTPGGGITMLSFIAVVLRGIISNLIVWLPLMIAMFALALSPLMQRNFGSVFELAAILGIGAIGLFLITSLGISLYSYLQRGSSSRRYQARRYFEHFIGLVLLLVFAGLGFASLAWLEKGLETSMHSMAGGGGVSLVAGAASAAWGLLAQRRIPMSMVAPVAALLFIYGILFLSYASAKMLLWYWPAASFYIAASCGVFGVLLGWFANLNYLSVHRYYRDRLMEAYMPAPGKAFAGRAGSSQSADPARLHRMADEAIGPYPLINTNLVLVNSKLRKCRHRGGDNFLLSPYYSGSNSTGWLPTWEYMGGGMTLATAMAISGAALNPNAGPDGTGLTRNVLVSFLMSFLNLRLGYWAPNPSCPTKAKHVPNHFVPGWYEMQNFFQDGGYTESKPYVQLSDGGHFENLGIYELLRRRVRVIVCSDAAEDKDFSFYDLQAALRKAQQDFGVYVDFGERLNDIIPSQSVAFPPGTQIAKQGYALGDVKYADGSQGSLLYLKSTMIAELSLQTKGYKGAHPDFPDQSTADQFFDEAQFAAYHELGYAIASQAMGDEAVNNLFR